MGSVECIWSKMITTNMQEMGQCAELCTKIVSVFVKLATISNRNTIQQVVFVNIVRA